MDRPSLVLAFSGRAADAGIRKALTAHGLKPGHGHHVLMLLADGGATSQQALAEAVGVDPSVMVTVLNDLEHDGLAERRRDPADRRRHIVEISARGTKLVAEIYRVIEGVEAELFADLDDAEIATLKGLLTRVKAPADDEPCTAED